MNGRPTTCPNGHPIEWFGEVALCSDGDSWIRLLPTNELEIAPSYEDTNVLPLVYAALQSERQARTAAETQATYWQREQAVADAKWKELQTALDTERQARQATEARAAKLESAVKSEIAWYESEGGPLWKMWEDCEIGWFDDWEWDWDRTFAACRNLDLTPEQLLTEPVSPDKITRYRQLLAALEPSP